MYSVLTFIILIRVKTVDISVRCRSLFYQLEEVSSGSAELLELSSQVHGQGLVTAMASEACMFKTVTADKTPIRKLLFEFIHAC